ncbi:hypothetical protein BY457_10214 [Marinilabilia salmonicolor]|jgi:hypothetical protein|nr:hypothetical protein BY457_10214 [Marinilabilia salmonicolor]
MSGAKLLIEEVFYDMGLQPGFLTDVDFRFTFAPCRDESVLSSPHYALLSFEVGTHDDKRSS